MAESHPLIKSTNSTWRGRDIIRIFIKTLIIIVLFNLAFIVLKPMPAIGKLSLYNRLYPGRLRLPYGDDPELSFNLTVNQLEAMFASHVIDERPKEFQEYRVLLIGDSSVWGFLQEPDQTLAGEINRLKLHTSDGKAIRFYNLGYPTLSLAKDLLILEYAQRYQPDLVLWFLTLESAVSELQMDSPLITFNPEHSSQLLLKIEGIRGETAETFPVPTAWEQSIFGQRRLLADIIRHQIYGVLWTATGVDHHIPDTYNRRTEDLDNDASFKRFEPGELSTADLAFDVIQAGVDLSGSPVILVNEPIFISDGENSSIRYNFYYPIWAFDFYKKTLGSEALERGWTLLDIWDILPGEVFTDSAIHYDQQGVRMVLDALLRSELLPSGDD